MTIVSAQFDEATFNELKSIALKNGLSNSYKSNHYNEHPHLSHR